MFSAMRHRFVALALGVCFILPAQAKNQSYGEIASMQARHIATVFPGRMTGTPAEMLSADYIRQQFADMGYESDIRAFHSRYIYTTRNKTQNWHNVTGSTVIAAHEGKAAEQIIIMAHLDTYTPLSDADVDNNLGGLTLQGLDDNAAGLGVMLELAERLKNIPTKYSIRFVATSGEEEGKLYAVTTDDTGYGVVLESLDGGKDIKLLQADTELLDLTDDRAKGLIGKWTDNSGNEYKLKKDGKLVIKSSSGETKGTYCVAENADGTLRLNLVISGGTLEYVYTLSDDGSTVELCSPGTDTVHKWTKA